MLIRLIILCLVLVISACNSNSQDAELNQSTMLVNTTASGLKYEVLRAADGDKPGPNSTVTVHYVGRLTDGTKFDSTYDRNQPATVPLTGVIPGFSEALQLMSVGSQYRVTIPPDLAYGDNRNGDIPPNSTLIFDIELLEINSN